MLHFEADIEFPQPLTQVRARLSDARFLVSCIPGVEQVTTAEPARAVCTLRPGFSFIRGTLEVTVTVLDSAEDQPVRLVAHSKGIGSSNDVEANLALTPREGGGTRVYWTADVVNLTGLLRAAPQGLMKAAAQKVIADVWVKVGEKLSS